jgi:threonine synthase
MKYFSTRNKNLNYSFKEVFLRGLAPDGGLFIPQKLKIYNSSELKELSKLKYTDLATEIISNFCVPDLEKNKLKALVEKAYKGFASKDVVTIKKIGNLNLLELYHGPTLAFKDIAMQVIGNIYNEFNSTDKKTINVIVATSGDTGSAAISALSSKPNINVFVLHPHNKISHIQRKIMTAVDSKNIYNIALQGNFDDCQKIVKDMFADNEFREHVNMSGVNSINWARIACQIVYYFYSSFKFPNKKINFSVPTGNFGDVYAGYVAKKMGLSINKLIVATNKNDILQRVINTGIYKPSKVEASLSPSMDIQISSNFERLLFDVLDMNDTKVINLMDSLNSEGFFKLKKEEVDIIKRDFYAEKTNDEETKKTIETIKNEHKFIIDPHTATAVQALKNINDDSETVVLGTAHPYKFLETIKTATGEDVKPPPQVTNLLDKKERYDILENKANLVKEYILKKAI